MALLALGELGGDEFRRRALHDFLFEARGQLGVKLGIAEQIARLQERGADRHIGLGLPYAFVDRTRRMADLQPHVPQAIEQRLGDRFAPGGLFVGHDEQQIDVGARRQQTAAVAAGGDHRHALGLGRDLDRIKLAGGELEQDADDLVLHPAQSFGATPALTLLQQQLLGAGARLRQRRFQALGDGGAQFALAPGMDLGERLEVGDDRRAVEEVGGGVRGAGAIEHHRTS